MRSLTAFLISSILFNVAVAVAAGGGGSSGGGSSGGGRGGSSGGGSSGGGKGGSSGGGSSGGKGGSSGGSGSGYRPSRPRVGGGVGTGTGTGDGDDGEPIDTGVDNYNSFSNAAYLPAPEQLQGVLGSLELRINSTNLTDASQHMSQVVEAIVAAPTCTPTITSGGPQLASITAPCTPPPISVTPTSSVSATAYLACMDYASIISSCASATSSFYNLPATEQALCACYTQTTADVSCVPTPAPTFTDDSYTWKFYQSATVTARATPRFDNAADACYGYFSAQGYSALASVMAGANNQGENVLGWQFCDNVHSQVSSAQNTASTTAWNVYPSPGLPSRIGETKTYGACQSAMVSRFGEGAAASAHDRIHRVVLVSFVVVISSVLFIMSG